MGHRRISKGKAVLAGAGAEIGAGEAAGVGEAGTGDGTGGTAPQEAGGTDLAPN